MHSEEMFLIIGVMTDNIQKVMESSSYDERIVCHHIIFYCHLSHGK